MKSIKLAQKTLLALGLSALVAIPLSAKTIDVSKSKKDIKVMTRIIETSLESSAKAFPGKLRITGTYLAKQGYLYTIQLNGMGSFGIPGIAAWDNGRIELDIPEMISEALSGIEYGEVILDDVVDPGDGHDLHAELAEFAEPIINSFEGIYNHEELQDDLRDLREKQREYRKETYQLRREIRKAEDQKKRAQLEVQLEKNNATIKQFSKDYNNKLNAYKNERKVSKIKKTSDAIEAVFSTICD
ncbi:MAG: hypothetical protein GY829_14440, partial [Gammaproteobacteria bacterium]|nr:hypothetical protein [Gammaproteobacteria bacterium]